MNSQHTEIPPAAEVPAAGASRSKDHQPTTTEGGDPQQHHTRRLRPGSKRAAVLRALLERGPRGLTRFEAERAPISDHVLPSTISELCADFGLAIPRKLVTVPGYGGTPTECALYCLSADDVEKVRELIGPDLAGASAEVREACRHWEVLYATPKVTTTCA